MKKTNRLIYLSIILAMVFALMGGSQAWAVTSTTSGNWSDATTWAGGVVPTSVDDVVIAAGHTVLVDGDYTIDDLTVASTGFLKPKTTGTYTLTLTGGITTTDAAAVLGKNSNGILNFVFNNTSTKAIAIGTTLGVEFYNVTLTAGTVLTLDDGVKLEGDLVVNNNASLIQSAGAFTVIGTNSTITRATLGTLTFYNLTFSATASNASTASSFTVAGVLTVASGAKFNASAGTITFTDSGTQNTLPVNSGSSASDLSFYNVTFDKDGSNFTPATSFQVKGNFTNVGTGNFTPTAGTIEFDNSASINDPKTITLTAGTLTFFFLKVTDASNVKTTASFFVSGTHASTSALTIEGTGSFVSTGSTTFTGAAGKIDVSNSGLLQLNNLIFANAATGFTSSSSLVLTGSLTVGTGSTVFSSPSVVAFKDTTDATGTKVITNGGTLTLNSLYVYDDVNTTTVYGAGASTVSISGDISVFGSSVLDITAGTTATQTIAMTGTTTKNIYNEGTLKFYNLTVANAIGNILTESNFEITNDFTAGGNDASDGAIIASGNSIITFSKAGDPFAGLVLAAHSFQSIKATAAITAVTAGNLLIIKGDLIVSGAGSIDFATAGNASTITFAGTAQQKIIGAVRLDEVYVNNSTGLVLEGNLTLGTAGTESATLTITNGFVDLNGNYNLILDHASGAITESTGKYVKNTKPGTGYITTLAGGTGFANINASGIGVTTITAGTDLVVERHFGARIIDGIESITRYYSINDGANDIDGAATRFYYDELELNGNTEAQLTAYLSGNPDAYLYSSDVSATTTATANWTHTNGAVTTASNYVAVDLSAGLTSATDTYIMLAPKFLKIAYFPTTSVEYRNLNATSPLAADANDKTILRFSLTATKTISVTDLFTALNVNFSRTPSGIFSNYRLYQDDDQDVSTYAYTSQATGSLSDNIVQFASLTEGFTAGQTEYYFIVADVDATVNSSTPNIYAYMDQDGITMNNITKMTQTINGPTYSFGALNTTLSSANSPSAGAIDIGTTGQTVYGFKLKPPTGSTVTFNSVNIKVTFDNGALYSDFENWKLYIDDNKNGIFDTGEELVGSAVTTIDQTTGILTFTEDATLVANEDLNFILITTVKSSATANGTLKAKITSYADVTLASPATIPAGGPYEGNSMTVRTSNGTPTRLSITAFSMKTIDGNSGRDYDLKAKGENEIVDDETLVLQVKAVDANGRPQQVDQATTVTLTPIGGGTVTNNTVSISIGSTVGLNETLTFSSASTANNFSLIATTTSGTSLTADTLTGIRVYSLEPSAFDISALAATTIQATTSTLSWTNGGTDNVLVVMKAGGWPTAPEDGVSYNSSANFSSPASSNGTTGTGSVVVYKGTGTSVNLTNLSANTDYYVKVYQFSGTGVGTNYLTWDVVPGGTYNSFGDQVQFSTKSAEPTAASTNMTFSSLTDESMKITWTKPTSGGGAYSLVVVGTADPSTTPTDTNTYTASSIYAEGYSLGTTGFVAYKGTGNTVTLTGLAANTIYYVRVYEFNGTTGNENFLITQYLSSNRRSLATEPTIQANNITFSEMTLGTNTSVRVNWIRGNGDGVLLVSKAGSPIGVAETPTDQSITVASPQLTYGTGTAIGQGYAMYLSTGNSAVISGLQYGQTYYFKAFEYNTGSGANTTTDNSTLNYNTDDATDNPNSRIADSYEPNEDLADAKFVASDGTLVSGLLTSADDADWFSFRPDFSNSADNVRIKLTGLPKNYTLELYRADGRLLRRSKILGTADEIVVLNNLPEADYYVKIYSADGEYSLTPYRVNVLNRTSDYQSDTQ